MSKFILRHILSVFCGVALLGGGRALADDLVPVAFTHLKMNMPDNKAAVLVESLSGHLRHTLVEAYAAETIGTTSAFSPQLETELMGGAGALLVSIDDTITRQVMPEIRPTLEDLADGESLEFSVEVLWGDSKTLDVLPQYSVLPSVFLDTLSATAAPGMKRVLGMRWIDADTVDQSGSARAALRTGAWISRLRTALPEQWTPWSSRFAFAIDRKGIRLVVNSFVLPARFSKNEIIEKPGLTIGSVVYIPQADADHDIFDMTRVTAGRLYATDAGSDFSSIRVSFGQYNRGQFNTCVGDECLRMADRVPTVHGYMRFAESSWWDAVTGWFRSWIVSDVRVKILLKDLFLAYDKNSNRLVVDAAQSAIPIIVRSDALFSGGKPFMLNNEAGYLGINFYENFVGSQITDGLSSDLNRALADADKALGGLIAQLAGAVVQ